MQDNNVLIIGAGSIGLRHQRLLRSLGCTTAFLSQRADLDEASFTTVEEALSQFKPHKIVVSNATSEHAITLKNLSAAGFTGRVLVEKPAALSDIEIPSLGFEKVFVGFNLRFHPVIQTLSELISNQTVLNVEAYAGQSLETWRPDREMSSVYSSHKASGGGVLRDLSHELDYLTLIFGRWNSLVALGGRISSKTVDSDDSWAIIASSDQVPQISLQLNYFDIPGDRRIKVNTTEATYEANLRTNEINISGSITPHPCGIDTTYKAMHQEFLNGSSTKLATADQAQEIDSLIMDIEESSLQRRWLTR